MENVESTERGAQQLFSRIRELWIAWCDPASKEVEDEVEEDEAADLDHNTVKQVLEARL